MICIVLIRATTNTPAASEVLKNMDRDVEPCDDFYKFACGGFLESTIIPDDKVSVNTFSIIVDALDEQLRASIEEEGSPNEPRPFKLVKEFYKTCMNKSRQHEMTLSNKSSDSKSITNSFKYRLYC